MRPLLTGVAVGAAGGLLAGFAAGRITATDPSSRADSHVVAPADTRTAQADSPKVATAARRERNHREPVPENTAPSIASPPAQGRATSPAAPNGWNYGPYGNAPLDELLATLERAAAGDLNIQFVPLLMALRGRFPATRLPPALVVPLYRRPGSPGIAFDAVAASWTTDEITSWVWTWSGSADRWEAGATLTLLGLLQNRKAPVERELAERLLRNEHASARQAGIRALAPFGAQAMDRLEEVARADPGSQVRQSALWAMTEIAEAGGDVAASERVVRLVEERVDATDLHERSSAITALQRLGPPGGALALQLLRDGTARSDWSAVEELVKAVLAAGRAADLLERESDPAVLRMVATRADRNPANLPAIAARIDELARVANDDEVCTLLWTVAASEYVADVARIARDGSAREVVRREAIEALWAAEGDTPPAARAAQETSLHILADPTEPVSLRAAALEHMIGGSDTPSTRAAAHAEALRVLHDRELPAELRWVVAERLGYLYDDATRHEAGSILARVAEDDPDSWVRARALQTVREMSQ